MSRLLARVAACTLALGGLWLAHNQNAPTGPVLKIDKIKPDLYVIAWAQGVGGGNVAVYVTPDGVILIDDMFDRNHDEIMAKVKSVTNLPIKYVLNTHQHDDHAGGNAKMAAGSQLIGHRRLRANMIALNQPGAPSITFSDEMDVFLGGKEVRALYFGRGHTGGDAVIYFPAEKTIHTGDLFLTNPTQPFIDYAQGGSALEWTGTLDKTLQLDFDTAIPRPRPRLRPRRHQEIPVSFCNNAQPDSRHGPLRIAQRRSSQDFGEGVPLGRRRTCRSNKWMLLSPK